MSLATVLDALQNSAVAHAVSKSDHLVGALLQVGHIFGIILLLGALLLSNLRLLGWVLPDTPLPTVTRETRRYFRIGLALTVVSGTLTFISTAKLYGANWMFWLKMALLVVAVTAHVLLLSRVLRQENPSRAAGRHAAALTLVLWLGVGFAGRLIGFM